MCSKFSLKKLKKFFNLNQRVNMSFRPIKAKVIDVTDEKDSQNNIFKVFIIKVVTADDDVVNKVKWNVVRTEDDFIRLHKELAENFGVMKSFKFRKHSVKSMLTFGALGSGTEINEEIANKFLKELVQLDNFPDAVHAFLSLEHLPELSPKSKPISTAHTVINTAATDSTVKANIVTENLQENVANDEGGMLVYYENPATVSPVELLSKILSMKRTISFTLTIFYIYAFYLMSLSAYKLYYHSHEYTLASVSTVIMKILASHFGKFQAQCRTMFFVIAVAMTYHRLVGYLLGLYLRGILDREGDGKFNLHFNWVAFRLGLDCNEIIIHGLTWRNPAQYHHTPYLLNIDEISFRVNISSVIRAIRDKKKYSIRIGEIRLNKSRIHMEKAPYNVTVFTEKVDENGVKRKEKVGERVDAVLNLWAALGATSVEQEEGLYEVVKNEMSAAVGGTATALTALGGAMLRYNPATLLYQGANTAMHNMMSLIGKKKPDGGIDGTEDTSAIDAASKEAIKSLEEGDETDDVTENGKNGKEKTKGMGIPFRFEVDKILIFDFRLHAQDLLNANHSKETKLSVIELQEVSMFRKDLTIRKGQGKREGIYLDTVLWRLINKLIAALIRHNSIAMITLCAAGAANHTFHGASAAVSGAGTLATEGFIGAKSLAADAKTLAAEGFTGAKLATEGVLQTGKMASRRVSLMGKAILNPFVSGEVTEHDNHAQVPSEHSDSPTIVK